MIRLPKMAAVRTAKGMNKTFAHRDKVRTLSSIFNWSVVYKWIDLNIETVINRGSTAFDSCARLSYSLLVQY